MGSWIAYLQLGLLSILLFNAGLGSRTFGVGHRAFSRHESCSENKLAPAVEIEKEHNHSHTNESSGSATFTAQKVAAHGSHHTNSMKVASAASQATAQGLIIDNLLGAAPRQTHAAAQALAQTMLYAFAALDDWRVHLCVGIGLLLASAVTLAYMRSTVSIRMSFLTWHVFLTVAIASTWVGTSQFAQGALARSTHSLTPLIIWVNSSAWLLLAIPHTVQRLWPRDAIGMGQSTTVSSSSSSSSVDVFRTRQTVIFFLIAFVTNSAYIAALRFLSASLNTAVFSTTSIFTFVFTLLFLKDDPTSVNSCGLRAICICLSVLGVVLITGLSSKGTGGDHDGSFAERLMGVALSITAALGTAVYQVAFKYAFGNRMTPVVVGLFLANLGAITCVFYGSVIFGGIAYGLVDIDLALVPWKFLLLTALSSTAFNFLIKFGIISTSPITVNLATQLGIPLNLGVDLLIVRAKIEPIQTVGVLVMLVSFSLNAYLDRKDVKSQAS